MLRSVTSLLVVLGVWAVAMPVSADFIIDVTATAGNEYNPAQWLINNAGGGMSEEPVTKTSLMGNGENGDGMWMANEPGEADKWVNFTFANPTSLQEIVIWNYNQESSTYPGLWQRGLKDVTITYSTGTDTTGLGNTLYANLQLNHANGANGEGYTDDLNFAAINDVKAVRIAYTSNWNDDTYAYNAAAFGLSEVGFVATPEPGTIVLLATGIIGLLAYAWRTHK
jgi:hypothetical protein